MGPHTPPSEGGETKEPNAAIDTTEYVTWTAQQVFVFALERGLDEEEAGKLLAQKLDGDGLEILAKLAEEKIRAELIATPYLLSGGPALKFAKSIHALGSGAAGAFLCACVSLSSPLTPHHTHPNTPPRHTTTPTPITPLDPHTDLAGLDGLLEAKELLGLELRVTPKIRQVAFAAGSRSPGKTVKSVRVSVRQVPSSSRSLGGEPLLFSCVYVYFLFFVSCFWSLLSRASSFIRQNTQNPNSCSIPVQLVFQLVGASFKKICENSRAVAGALCDAGRALR
jgi:hypothetical protein